MQLINICLNFVLIANYICKNHSISCRMVGVIEYMGKTAEITGKKSDWEKEDIFSLFLLTGSRYEDDRGLSRIPPGDDVGLHERRPPVADPDGDAFVHCGKVIPGRSNRSGIFSIRRSSPTPTTRREFGSAFRTPQSPIVRSIG